MAKLSTAMRKAMKPSQFAFPATKEYPLNDENHARDALSRGSANATPAQQATIKSKVAAKFPGIQQRAGARIMRKRG